MNIFGVCPQASSGVLEAKQKLGGQRNCFPERHMDRINHKRQTLFWKTQFYPQSFYLSSETPLGLALKNQYSPWENCSRCFMITIFTLVFIIFFSLHSKLIYILVFSRLVLSFKSKLTCQQLCCNLSKMTSL